MATLRIALILLWLSPTAAWADSFFFLKGGPFTGNTGQWISSDAPSGRPDFGRIPMPSWLPQKFYITGCRVIAWPEGDPAKEGSAFWVNLSLAVDHGGVSFGTGNPNIPGGQVGADYSHNDTLCVQGFEWGKFVDSREFTVPQLFDRTAHDLFWFTLGAAVPVAFINFQIHWQPVP